jgi:hypothetical protein
MVPHTKNPLSLRTAFIWDMTARQVGIGYDHPLTRRHIPEERNLLHRCENLKTRKLIINSQLKVNSYPARPWPPGVRCPTQLCTSTVQAQTGTWTWEESQLPGKPQGTAQTNNACNEPRAVGSSRVQAIHSWTATMTLAHSNANKPAVILQVSRTCTVQADVGASPESSFEIWPSKSDRQK